MLKTIAGLEGILGALMLIVPIIDVITYQPVSYPFLLGGVLFIFIGLLSERIEAKPLSLQDSLVVVSLAWPIISLEAAIALMFSINISFIDSWFESISGFTGTGFTVLTGIDYMKPSIVTWRSIMQWSGELGFVVFAMVILPYFYHIGKGAYGIERPVKIEASFYRTARLLLKIYLILTIAGLVSYLYAGMNLYEAFNHILTTIATGGMSTYDAGYQVIFDRAPYTYIPVMVFMFIGGMNFYIIARVFKGDLRSLVKSEEFRAYVYSMLFLTFLTILSYIYVERASLTYSLIAGSFNFISGMTTTGFSIGVIGELSDATKAIIIAGMFIGGMMFSTAGGIKSIRLLIIFKKIKDIAIKAVLAAPIEKRVSVDGNPLSEDEVSQALLFTITHMMLIFFGALFMTFYGYSFIDTLFEATSAAGCVGLSTGVLSPTAPVGVKVTIMALMLLGRLEYVQLSLLIAYFTGKRALRMLY